MIPPEHRPTLEAEIAKYRGAGWDDFAIRRRLESVGFTAEDVDSLVPPAPTEGVAVVEPIDPWDLVATLNEALATHLPHLWKTCSAQQHDALTDLGQRQARLQEVLDARQ